MSICTECHTEFEPKDKRYAKFCSRSCGASFNNRKSPKRKRLTRESVFCRFCNKPVSYRNKFCNQSCQAASVRKARIADWLSGKWDGSDRTGVMSQTVRNYLLDLANHKCTRCDWGEINPSIKHGRPVLTIDHIDGNWKNNRPENLVVLCYNCHTLTPNWGSLSKNGMSRERMGRGGNSVTSLPGPMQAACG